jgi:FkbH-like protein
MKSLAYMSRYAARDTLDSQTMRKVRLHLITNFTDDVLERVVGGMCLEEQVYPEITRSPYKQYIQTLLKKELDTKAKRPDITFVFFDASTYRHSEFLQPEHRMEVLSALKEYVQSTEGTTVVSLLSLPYVNVHGHRFQENPLYLAVQEFNAGLVHLEKEYPSLYLHDAEKIFHHVGERSARDVRGHHAFDMPFTTEFLTLLAADWLSYIRATTGTSRKCIVLDLDNTLWGGVVGEDGPLGIELGPEYPGTAYQNFQHALQELRDRGVVLAVCSKNNEADVYEVFEKNPHMLLHPEDFAAMRINWDDKSINIREIAKELNIGLDSIVVIDDSPLERENIRTQLPEVLTPEWSFPPEEYIPHLQQLNVFHQMTVTEEDRKKNQMYQDEIRRKEVKHVSSTPEEYIAKLGIAIEIRDGTDVDIPRVAQLTQKTNQFNLTTKRYSESDIHSFIESDTLVITGEVADTFGSYGVTILGIVLISGKEAVLDTYLMSCRVMGRTVEDVFFGEMLQRLSSMGIDTLKASFIPSKKNAPAADFLSRIGGRKTSVDSEYFFDIGACVAKLTTRTEKPIIKVIHRHGHA